jgi:hypothetical protein
MEPFTLAAAAFNIIKPFLKIGAEAATKEAGKSLWETVKGLFQRHHKSATLQAIEAKPDDVDTVQLGEDQLAAILNRDPAAKGHLETEMNKLINSGVYQVITGDYNITIQATGSHVTVNQTKS